MEQLELTDPIIKPEVVTSTYHVLTLTLDREAMLDPSGVPGAVLITLKDNNGVRSHYSYTGDVAQEYMKWMNTANFTTTSMHKRLLQKLSADGSLPGTVTGTPDPPSGR